MNLPRLRELLQAGKDGTLQPEEAKELFEALPEVLDKTEQHAALLGVARKVVDEFDKMPRLPTNQDCSRAIFKMAPYFAQFAAAVDCAD